MKRILVIGVILLAVFAAQNVFAREAHMSGWNEEGNMHVNGQPFKYNAGDRGWHSADGQHHVRFDDGGMYFNDDFFGPCGFDDGGNWYLDNPDYPPTGWCAEDGRTVTYNGDDSWVTNF